jgi:hypothetical protein
MNQLEAFLAKAHDLDPNGELRRAKQREDEKSASDQRIQPISQKPPITFSQSFWNSVQKAGKPLDEKKLLRQVHEITGITPQALQEEHLSRLIETENGQ